MKVKIAVLIKAPGEMSRTRMEISVPQGTTVREIADGIMSVLKSEQMRRTGDLAVLLT